MKTIIARCLLVLILTCETTVVRASDEFGFDNSGVIKLGFSGIQNGDLFGRDRDHFERSTDITGTVPVCSVKNGTSNTKFFVSVGLNSIDEQLPDLPRALRFYDGRITAGMLKVKNTRDTYTVRLGAGFAEEQNTLSDVHPRLSVLAMGIHHGSGSMTYLYGVSYSYILGRAFLLPAFGMNWKIDEKRDLNFIVPFLVRYSYIINKQLKVSLFTSLFGNQFRLRNESFYPGASDNLLFHTVGLKLGAGLEYKPYASWVLGVDVADVVRRDITITTDANDKLSSEQLQGGFFFQLFIKRNFGKREYPQL